MDTKNQQYFTINDYNMSFYMTFINEINVNETNFLNHHMASVNHRGTMAQCVNVNESVS